MTMKVARAGVAMIVGQLLTACAPGGTEPGPTRPDGAAASGDASSSINAAKARAAEQHASDVAKGNERSEPAEPDLGIFDSAEAPFASVDFRATTHWGGKVGGKAFAVYAGADGQHASVGEVIVQPFGGGSSPTTFHRLGGAGALRLVSEDGGALVLKDASGDTHLFDVGSGSFQG